MRLSPVILIGAPHEVSALKSEPTLGGEVLMFADTEYLRASQAITSEKPRVVVLGRGFAGTGRGASLVNTIKSDHTLSRCQIRVLNQARDYARLVDRQTAGGVEPGAAVPGDPLPPDYLGTRNARRHTLTDTIQARLAGNTTTLIDLSWSGAQVVGQERLRPNQRVRLEIGGSGERVGGTAVVVWVSFEPMTKGAARYRAGLRFTDADPEAVDGFCLRHRRPAVEAPPPDLGEPEPHIELAPAPEWPSALAVRAPRTGAAPPDGDPGRKSIGAPTTAAVPPPATKTRRPAPRRGRRRKGRARRSAAA